MGNNLLFFEFLNGIAIGIGLYGVGQILEALHISRSFATSSSGGHYPGPSYSSHGHHGIGHHKGSTPHHHKHKSHTRLDESDVLRASGQDPPDSFPKLSTN
jgi:hypothetical protein